MLMAYRSTDLNANLIKSGAALAESRTILRSWLPGEAPGALADRVVAENLLGKPSRSRTDDVVRMVLLRRYFPGKNEHPAAELARLSAAELPHRVLDLLLYYHAALAEHLLYLAATALLFPLHENGAIGINTGDVEAFLAELAQDERFAVHYTPEVRTRTARGVLTALRDFGILEGKVIKRFAALRAPHEVIAYVAYVLNEEGLPPRRIVEHPDWRLFLLNPAKAESALLEAAQHGHFRYESIGSIRRFDWRYSSVTEYVDGLVGTVHR